MILWFCEIMCIEQAPFLQYFFFSVLEEIEM